MQDAINTMIWISNQSIRIFARLLANKGFVFIDLMVDNEWIIYCSIYINDKRTLERTLSLQRRILSHVFSRRKHLSKPSRCYLLSWIRYVWKIHTKWHVFTSTNYLQFYEAILINKGRALGTFLQVCRGSLLPTANAKENFSSNCSKK